MTRKDEVAMAIENDRWADEQPNFRADDRDLTDYCGLQDDYSDDGADEPLPTGYYNRSGDWVSFNGAELELLDDCDDSIAIDDDDDAVF